MKDKIIIDGEEYIKKDSMGALDGVFFDNFHIILHRKNIEIKGKICMCCGREFTKEEINKFLTKHHSIPIRFKSIFNVYVPVCESCHQKIDNGMKKKSSKKDKNRLKDTK